MNAELETMKNGCEFKFLQNFGFPLRIQHI